MNKIDRINNVLGLDLVTTCNNLGCTVHEVQQYVGVKYRGKSVLSIRVSKFNNCYWMFVMTNLQRMKSYISMLI